MTEERQELSRSPSLMAMFMVGHSWRLMTWSTRHASIHLAVVEKARELQATAWDFGQARWL